ncbi:hypothetical protein [Methanobacterium petrolearium]|uniref:hypothetical protein n=1 Tax=Methanobacterium petrolearium TaxID=710190 RepID=UPI001AE29103|nr:hypothetical protein [Methanobacterium petrolearium]MBP1945486.1 hypothetical protein [Methanobacterium petrolearium]BDZ71694.1 hypothetical protein GCM10025861_22110 [Methanobacterium petrolearium]
MKMSKNVQLKLAFCMFAFLLVFAFSGAVSARAVVDDVNTTPLVVETGETFNSTTAIQDAIDDEDTLSGHHIQLQPVNYLEQIYVTKDLTISGVTSYPTDTNIGYDTIDGVIIVPSGVSVVLENMAIWTRDENAFTINNNGQLTLINCMLNGVYYEYDVSGTVETFDSSPEAMASGSPEEEFLTESTSTLEGDTVTETGSAGTTETTTETTETSGTETNTPTGNTDTTEDPSVPLASLASGMLMLMGGTVISKRE